MSARLHIDRIQISQNWLWKRLVYTIAISQYPIKVAAPAIYFIVDCCGAGIPGTHINIFKKLGTRYGYRYGLIARLANLAIA